MIRNFDPFTYRILSAFCPGKEPNVVGSMRLQGMYWPTDFDQFQLIEVKTPKDAVLLLRRAIHSLRSIPNVRVPEIKWAGRNMKPSMFLATPTSHLAQELLKTKGKVKLDAVAWLDSSARYAEFSCVYVFETPKGTLNPLPAQIESLQEEMKELWDKGKYFKLIKRMAALQRAQGKSTAKFDAFFRGDYGLLYSVFSDLSTLEDLSHLPERRLAIELGAIVNRLGGVQLRNKSLQGITMDLREGKYENVAPILEGILDTGAFNWLHKYNIK
jgi:hypothetical protein